MKKIFAWEQYKYMIVILVLCISHFLVVGLLFGFEALLNDYSFLYYIQLSLGLSLLAPLLFVLTIRFHDDIRILFDGKTMIVFLVYSIPIVFLAYLFFIIFSIIQQDALMAELSVQLLTFPIIVIYTREWYDSSFND